MSININLLPAEIKMQWTQRRRRQKIIAAAGIAGILVLFVYSTLLLTTFQARAEVTALQKERLVLEQHFPALEQYAQLQTRVVHSEGIIKQAMGTPPDWVSVLNDIGRYIPVNVWLTYFSAKYEHVHEQKKDTNLPANRAVVTNAPAQSLPVIPGGKSPLDGEVVIRGYAYDHRSVAQWLEQIRQVSGLTGVSCQFSTGDNLDGKDIVSFEIKAQILPGPPAPYVSGKAVAYK
ncbi:MAG: PilN domain-containing protein [Firmicutes bacterium]|nr:PilN domain-containing protein [Bacillota bacterium]